MIAWRGIGLAGETTENASPAAVCPDLLRYEQIGAADGWRGRVVRTVFFVLRLWPPCRTQRIRESVTRAEKLEEIARLALACRDAQRTYFTRRDRESLPGREGTGTHARRRNFLVGFPMSERRWRG